MMENLKSYNKFKDLDQDSLDIQFINACENGDLETVKYLLTSADLNNHANVNSGKDYGFNLACGNGHLDIVRYLLTSQEIKEEINISGGFRWACEFGFLDVVKYLLTSPELKNHADIHQKTDYPFKWACYNKKLDIIQFMIFDMNIKKTKNIEKYLKENPNKQVENWFKLRDLNKNLEKDLNFTKINKKTRKV